MNLNDLMRRMEQENAVYREARLHDDLFRMAGLHQKSLFDQITQNIELSATKRLKDLIYPASVSSMAKHFSALEGQAATINKLDLFSGISARSALNAALEPPDVSKRFLASHCGINIEEMFKKETAIDKLISAGTVASVFSPTKAELFDVAASIKTPWIDAANPLRSIESITGLATLGKAINLAPFGDKAVDTINSLVGDWGKIGSIAVAVPNDWLDRKNFYFAHGFDRRLTELPDSAFTQSLYSTELLRPDLFSPVFPHDTYSTTIFPAPAEQLEEEESEEDALKRRMLEAYDLLFNLETQLREYIVEVMNRKYGAKWVKQRITEVMRRQWADKKETALGRGEEELPLIWYADFSDYLQIIIRTDNWNDIFENLFFNKIDVQASFQRLQPLRICTMHARPISREDLLLITVEAHRILRAIGKIKGCA